MNSSRKIYLIDLDGTLLQAQPVVFFWLNIFYILKNFLPVVGPVGVFRILLPSVKHLIRNPHSHLSNFESLVAQLQILSGKNLESHLWDFYRKDFPKLGRFCSPILPAQKAMQRLKNQGHTLYLTTNAIWPEEAVLLRLQWAGLDPHLFSGITHSQNWHACKPSVKYYQEVLARWNLKAENCVLIGDSELKEGPARKLGIEVKITPRFDLEKFWEMA